jgi:hypothetical protein
LINAGGRFQARETVVFAGGRRHKSVYGDKILSPQMGMGKRNIVIHQINAIGSIFSFAAGGCGRDE